MADLLSRRVLSIEKRINWIESFGMVYRVNFIVICCYVELMARPAVRFEDLPKYLCVRIGELEKGHQHVWSPMKSYKRRRLKPEYWFSIPIDRWRSQFCTYWWHQNHVICCNVELMALLAVPSVLWCCWLAGTEGIRSVKNWLVRCWRGYLSGARCRLAYGPADATATHCLLLQ